MAFANVSKGVDFWVERGLLREIAKRKRNRLFKAEELLQLMSGAPSYAGNHPTAP